MNQVTRIVLLLTAALSACGGDGGPTASTPAPTGPVPVSITVSNTPAEQTVVIGAAAAIQPEVLVRDAMGRGVGGVAVSFLIVEGTGTVGAAVVTTDSRGVATTAWTMGTTFGVARLEARAGALAPAVFRARVVAPASGVVAFTTTDPAGDTIPDIGSTVRGVDLLSLRGDFVPDSLIITATFAAPISMAPGDSGAVQGFIEIDLDDLRSTGDAPISSAFGASAALGVDALIVILPNPANRVSVLRGEQFGFGVMRVSGATLTLRIPMSALGNDDGNFQLVGALGIPSRPTDIVPNAGVITVRR